MLEGEVLVRELIAVDGLATGDVAGGEVATLAHELRDDAVEGGALEVVTPGIRALCPVSALGLVLVHKFAINNATYKIQAHVECRIFDRKCMYI